ncbi:MAG: thioredoxin family protein [Bacillota bacterium]
MKKKAMVQIAVVLIVGLLVVGIWVIKNNENESEKQAASSDAEDAINTAASSAETNADFALEAEAINLEQLLACQLPIIIDFGADSCVPCKEMAPMLQTMNAEMLVAAIIKFVDVWKHASAADGFPIQVIPTQVFINADGTPYAPSEDMGVEFTLYSYTDTGAHAFTIHQGGLTEDQMRAILADMGASK